jgi:hypothetical protein
VRQGADTDLEISLWFSDLSSGRREAAFFSSPFYPSVKIPKAAIIERTTVGICFKLFSNFAESSETLEPPAIDRKEGQA